MNLQLENFLQIVFAFGLVLTVAHASGRLIQFIGQPKVVGEMVAGVLLGPSLFGLVAPEWSAATFGPDVKSAIFMLSQIGLAGFMFLVGCELDMGLFNKKSLRRAATLSLTGIIPSMIIGGICGAVFFQQLATGSRAIGVWEFAFFMGSALSITAFPMLARILEENGLAAAPVGVLSILAASIDDALAWCLLALIIALARAESLVSGFLPILGAMAFFAACFFILRPLLTIVARKAEARGFLNQEEFALVLVLLLAAIWVTDRIGIYSVFGGFALGVCMPRSAVLLRDIRAHMYQFVVVFFLPLFFVNSGLNTNMASLFSANLFVPFLVILFASFITKYVFCTAAMRAIGFSWRESSAIGGLFNARGLILLIFGNIGVAHGLIDGNVFTMLTLVAILTTAAAMPIFRLSLDRSMLTAPPEARRAATPDEPEKSELAPAMRRRFKSDATTRAASS